MHENFWFAEKTTNRAHPWVPTLQTDSLCLSLPIWFATEEECQMFIKEEIEGTELNNG